MWNNPRFVSKFILCQKDLPVIYMKMEWPLVAYESIILHISVSEEQYLAHLPDSEGMVDFPGNVILQCISLLLTMAIYW